jgi:hypothetical protein
VTRLARGLARALFWVGVSLIALGIVCAGLSLYVGSWPIRRLAGRSSTGARVASVQELLAAVAGAVAAFRTTE